MAQKASGADQLISARELLRTAKTAEELRMALAVLLPLELSLSLEQTATAIGRSVGATCTLAPFTAMWCAGKGKRHDRGEACLTEPMRRWNARHRFSMTCWKARCAAALWWFHP